MGAIIANHGVGKEGVNLVKNPLQLSDGEATQLQNAELVPDQATGGEGSLSKRGGLAALTSALAGSVLGMMSLPLQTTYTRYLYCGQGNADSDTWLRTTDGSTWVEVASPARPARTYDKYYTPHSGQTALVNCSRRGVSYKTRMLFMGDDYTVGSTCPPVIQWDESTSVELFRIPIGPNSDGDEPTAVTDMLLANGKIYFAIAEKAAGGAFHGGRVMEYDPRTSIVKQVCNSMGVGAGEVDGQNVPTCLAYYQGQLWVGLHASNSGVATIGKVIRCYPDVDTVWTTDVANLTGKPNSLLEFGGDLYVATSLSDSSGTISKRSAASTAWSDVASLAQSDYTMLREYGGKLYAVRYTDDVSDSLLILESSDGSSWSTSRDVYANDSGGVLVHPVGAAVFNDRLFYAFEPVSHADNGTGGFILMNNAGTWSKIHTGNVNGPMITLVQRS